MSDLIPDDTTLMGWASYRGMHELHRKHDETVPAEGSCQICLDRVKEALRASRNSNPSALPQGSVFVVIIDDDTPDWALDPLEVFRRLTDKRSR